VVIGGKGFPWAGRRPEVGWIGSERVGDFAWERSGESEVGKNHLEPNTEDAKRDKRRAIHSTKDFRIWCKQSRMSA